MKKKEIQGSFRNTLLTEIRLYILCFLIFYGCGWASDGARSVFLFLIFSICSIIQFVILFKKSLRLHDKYLFPFIFLLPLFEFFDYHVLLHTAPLGSLLALSTFVIFLRAFFILDFLGLCMLLRPEKKQEITTLKHDGKQERKKVWLDILCRIPFLVILAILYFQESKCGDLGCLLVAIKDFALIILFYFIFPTKSIVLLIQFACRAKSSKQVSKRHTKTKQKFLEK